MHSVFGDHLVVEGDLAVGLTGAKSLDLEGRCEVTLRVFARGEVRASATLEIQRPTSLLAVSFAEQRVYVGCPLQVFDLATLAKVEGGWDDTKPSALTVLPDGRLAALMWEAPAKKGAKKALAPALWIGKPSAWDIKIALDEKALGGVFTTEGTGVSRKAPKKRPLTARARLHANGFGLALADAGAGVALVLRAPYKAVDFQLHFGCEDNLDLSAEATPDGLLTVHSHDARTSKVSSFGPDSLHSFSMHGMGMWAHVVDTSAPGDETPSFRAFVYDDENWDGSRHPNNLFSVSPDGRVGAQSDVHVPTFFNAWLSAVSGDLWVLHDSSEDRLRAYRRGDGRFERVYPPEG